MVNEQKISQERIYEIAFLVLLEKYRNDGMRLQPKEIKRDIINLSKKFGITVQAAVALTRLILNTIYQEVVQELDKLDNKK